MANTDITFIPDADPESISSDVAGFGGLLVSSSNDVTRLRSGVTTIGTGESTI